MNGRRVVWPTQGRAELEEYEVPPLPSGALLIETAYSVVSAGTEKAVLLGMPNTPNKFPQYPGYSAAGRVIEVAPDVEDFRAGDRVVVYQSGHASHAIKRPEHVTRIENDAVATMEAAFIVIASMSLQGVRKARLEIGESALVIGQGLLGLFATQLARINGAVPVVAVDLDPERRRLAGELGADHTLWPSTDDLDERIRALTHGQGANAIIEVTGSPDAMMQALACAAKLGRIVVLGCTRNTLDNFDFYRDVHRPGVSIIGAHNFIRPKHDSSPGYWTMQDDFRTLLTLLALGRLQVGPIISEQARPEQAPEIYRRLCETDRSPLGIVFDWEATG